jgi:hypothetical protein
MAFRPNCDHSGLCNCDRVAIGFSGTGYASFAANIAPVALEVDGQSFKHPVRFLKESGFSWHRGPLRKGEHVGSIIDLILASVFYENEDSPGIDCTVTVINLTASIDHCDTYEASDLILENMVYIVQWGEVDYEGEFQLMFT